MRSAKQDATVAEAVRHPLRVRILEVLNERDMSPTDFVNDGYADFYFGRRPSVSHVAYHFRELAQFGCLEGIAWRRVRGSVGTVYRGVARDEFVGDEWASLSDEEKRDFSRSVARGLVARIDGAMRADTFNSRDDRQLSWFAMEIDERGWQEATTILADAYAGIKRIREAAEARLRESDEKGLTVTAGILIFESPELASPSEGPD